MAHGKKSMKGRILSISILGMMLMLISCMPKDRGRVRLDVSWEKMMRQQDMIWDTLTSNIYEAPVLGNPLIGVLVHSPDQSRKGLENNVILFDLNRSDVVDTSTFLPGAHFFSRYLLGQFALYTRGKIKHINLRFDLWNAELNGKMITDSGTVNLRVIVHSSLPLLVTEASFTGTENASWEYIPVPAGKICLVGNSDEKHPKPSGTNMNMVKETRANMVQYRQKLRSGLSYSVGTVTEKMLKGARFFSAISVTRNRVEGELDAFSELKRGTMVNFESLVSSHRRWWHQYYAKTFISLPDMKIENFYWIQKYKAVCGIIRSAPIILPGDPGQAIRSRRWAEAALDFAVDGHPDSSLKQLNTYLSQLTPNTLMSTDNTVNASETALSTIQKMLLQFKDSTLYVFPGIPSTWKDVSFHGIMAGSSYMISAAYSNGRTDFISIMSLDGKPCKLQTDLPADSIGIESKPPVRVRKTGAHLLEISMPRSERVIIYKKGRRHRFIIKPANNEDQQGNWFGYRKESSGAGK